MEGTSIKLPSKKQSFHFPMPFQFPISLLFFSSIGLHLNPIFPISSQVPIPPSPSVPQEDGAASGARPTGHAAHVRGHASAAPRAAQLPRVQRDATPARSHQVGATCPGRGGGCGGGWACGVCFSGFGGLEERNWTC